MHLFGKKPKSLLSLMMSLVMLVSLLPPSFIVQAEELQKEASKEVSNVVKENQEYEIYPIPQSIVYNEGSLDLGTNVNVVFEEGLDPATKDRLIEVLKIKNINHTVATEIQAGVKNVIVGINGSNGIVDKYFSEKGLADDAHFEKTDSHIVSVDNDVIAVLGKDTDSAFYGITTLKMIFKQLEGSEIRNLLIKDYSDALWRGFIEGYYGIPWSNEDRMSLMEFGGDIKMNAYMFAPKDDEYHSSKWREPYPEEKLEGIREMVEVGTKSKNKFIWTIHPFMYNPIRFDTEEHYQEDLEKIITKFEQLYDVGVRQFGVLADDAGGDAANQVKLMKDLEKWRLGKEGVYNLIFVPKEYNEAFAGYNINSPYLKKIAEMPRDIEIMWTGSSVCGWVTESTFNWFKTALTTPDHPGRDAFMWLNWPVNDINSARLVMGKGQMLDPNVTNFRGIVTNPMQQAEASKVALFAVADYTWHRDAFNANKSWADSFKYIDPDAGEELHTLAKHMSDPAPNGHGLVQDESEEIKPLLEEFKRKYAANESILEIGKTLIAEFEEIVQATIDFDKKSKNEALKEEIDPWRQSLKALAESAIEYIQTAIALEEGNNSQVWSHYSEAAAKFELSKTYEVQNLNGRRIVEAGYKRLIPFVKDLGKSLADKVSDIVNPGEEKLTLRPYTNVTNIYQGSIENLTDGDSNTKVWFGRYIQANDYVAVELSKETEIHSLSIEQGKSATDKDAFYYGKFQYSMDGENWVDVNNKTYGPYVNTAEANNLDITAKHVRFVQTGDLKPNNEANPKWAAFREFKINEESDQGALTPTLIKSDNIGKRQGGNEADLVKPEGAAQVVMYAKAPYENPDRDSIPAGAYIGVDLGREVKLGSVSILGDTTAPGDIFKEAVLEYSVDGQTYHELDTFNNQVEINENYSQREVVARYVRLKNVKQVPVWARFKKFYVTESDLNTKVYTNVPALADNKAKVLPSVATITDLQGITLEKDQYIGIKLPRIRDLVNIVANYTNKENLTLETSMNGIEWTTVTDVNTLEDARYIRIINKTDNAVTFDIVKLEVNSLEYEGKTVHATNFTSVENPTNAFDNSWTTQAWFKNDQNPGKYVTYDLGRTINVNSLKMVLNDYENDFIRNGKISLSADGQTWTDAIIIGGDHGSDAKIEDIYPDHEISYYTISARDLDVDARYLKVEITKSPNVSKWVRFNEIVINDGEYIPSENNPTFVSNPVEQAGYAPSALIDGNLNTTYKPNAQVSESGSLTYRISEKTKINKISILQSPNTISNAKVSVRNADGWTEVGKLDRSLNDFNTSSLGNVFEIKLEWDGVSPTLHEIITSNSEYTVDMTELTAAIEAAEATDTTMWTQASKDALTAAIKEAKAIKTDVYASQNKVDDMIRTITNVIENAEIIETNKDILEATINVAKEKKQADYISSTWTVFADALAAAETMFNKVDATQEEVDAAVKVLEDAQAALVKKADYTYDLEFAVGMAEEVTEEQLENVVPAVVKEFKAALAEAKAILAGNDSSQAQVDASFDRLAEAMQHLSFIKGDKTRLIALVDKIAKLDEERYISSTWEKLQDSVVEANKVITNENALEVEVKEAHENLLRAFLNLQVRPSKEALEDFINKAEQLDATKYTEETWSVLEKALKAAKEVMANKDASQQEVNHAVATLSDAINGLEEKEEVVKVDKTKLEALIDQAIEILENDLEYTNESLEAFMIALDDAFGVFEDENATQAMADEAAKNLEAAIKGLVEQPVTPPTDNPDGDKPGTDDQGTDKTSTDKPGTDNTQKPSQNPSTGDNGVQTNMLLTLGSAILLFALVGVRRFKENK